MTRPTRPAVVACRDVKRITPITMSRGDSQDRSKEKTTAIRLVPMSAPSITASPAPVAIKPCPTNEDAIRQVAVLLWMSPVTPSPASIAVNWLSVLCLSTRRRSSPRTRSTPVRTV